jgi:hypothetical protein
MQAIRVLVTGPREWSDWRAVYRALADTESANPDGWFTLVHGGARGADSIAAAAGTYLGWHMECHPAEWATYGPAAGLMRNQDMVNAGADICIAFVMPCKKPDCRRRPVQHPTHGTADCMRRAKEAGIPVREVRPSR